MNNRKLFTLTTAGAVGILLLTSLTGLRGQAPAAAVAIDADDIGGVVTGSKGPEAGVWVIAETRDTPTRLIKIVVTDDNGRYLVPDLPKGNYDVWVRGYGLIDSAKVKAAPGTHVNLTALEAPNARAAAQYYPAQYWFSLMEVPPKSDFPGTGPTGQRHFAEREKPGRVDSQHHQHRRLQRLPSAGQQGDARAAAGPAARSRRPTRHGTGGFSPVRPAAA